MIFLVTYDRQQGELRRLVEYDDADIDQANAERLKSEIESVNDAEVEIVILRSDSKEELKRTHARYFKSLNELQRF